MDKIVRNIRAKWTWQGDLFALKGFNLAICENEKLPTEESIIQVFVDKSSYKDGYWQHTLRNLVLNNNSQYKPWVQAVYEGKDSDWVSIGGLQIADDGIATLETQGGSQEKANTALEEANSKLKDLIQGKTPFPDIDQTFISGREIKTPELTAPIIKGSTGYIAEELTIGQGSKIKLDGVSQNININNRIKIGKIGDFWGIKGNSDTEETFSIDATTGEVRMGNTNSNITFNPQTGKLILQGSMVQTPAGDQVAIVAHRGTFDETGNTTYYKNDTVTYNGSTYIYINDTPTSGNIPTNTTYWSVYASKGDQGEDGKDGPGLAYQGEFKGNYTYYYIPERRDVVKKVGIDEGYYLLKNPTSIDGIQFDSWHTEDWEPIGASFSFVATDILLAENATIDKKLTIGRESSAVIIDGNKGKSEIVLGDIRLDGISKTFEVGSPTDDGAYVKFGGDKKEATLKGATIDGVSSSVISQTADSIQSAVSSMSEEEVEWTNGYLMNADYSNPEYDIFNLAIKKTNYNLIDDVSVNDFLYINAKKEETYLSKSNGIIGNAWYENGVGIIVFYLGQDLDLWNAPLGGEVSFFGADGSGLEQVPSGIHYRRGVDPEVLDFYVRWEGMTESDFNNDVLNYLTGAESYSYFKIKYVVSIDALPSEKRKEVLWRQRNDGAYPDYPNYDEYITYVDKGVVFESCSDIRIKVLKKQTLDTLMYQNSQGIGFKIRAKNTDPESPSVDLGFKAKVDSIGNRSVVLGTDTFDIVTSSDSNVRFNKDGITTRKGDWETKITGGKIEYIVSGQKYTTLQRIQIGSGRHGERIEFKPSFASKPTIIVFPQKFKSYVKGDNIYDQEIICNVKDDTRDGFTMECYTSAKGSDPGTGLHSWVREIEYTPHRTDWEQIFWDYGGSFSGTYEEDVVTEITPPEVIYPNDLVSEPTPIIENVRRIDFDLLVRIYMYVHKLGYSTMPKYGAPPVNDVYSYHRYSLRTGAYIKFILQYTPNSSDLNYFIDLGSPKVVYDTPVDIKSDDIINYNDDFYGEFVNTTESIANDEWNSLVSIGANLDQQLSQARFRIRIMEIGFPQEGPLIVHGSMHSIYGQPSEYTFGPNNEWKCFARIETQKYTYTSGYESITPGVGCYIAVSNE